MEDTQAQSGWEPLRNHQNFSPFMLPENWAGRTHKGAWGWAWAQSKAAPYPFMAWPLCPVTAKAKFSPSESLEGLSLTTWVALPMEILNGKPAWCLPDSVPSSAGWGSINSQEKNPSTAPSSRTTSKAQGFPSLSRLPHLQSSAFPPAHVLPTLPRTCSSPLLPENSYSFLKALLNCHPPLGHLL